METANIITINTDDMNLAEVIKKIIAEAGLTVADLFEDSEVCDHIHESGIPIEQIYDEDDILSCGCVTDKIEELEDRIGELQEENDELDTKNAKLKTKNAELKRQLTDEDKLRENDVVQNILEQEREGLMDDGWGKVEEKDDEIGQLEETIAELKQEIAQHKKKVAEQEKELEDQQKQMDEIIGLTLKRHGRCDDGRGGVFEFVDSDEEEDDDIIEGQIVDDEE